MTPDQWRELADQITVAVLRRYLIATGWAVRFLDNDRTDYFFRERDGRIIIELFIPKSERSEGHSRYKTLAIQSLSDYLGMDATATFNSIRSIAFDIIYAAIPSEAIMWRSVYLDTAESVLRHARRLLALSATANEKTERHYKSTSYQGDEYARRCRFAHTVESSFGFVIESPIGHHNEHLLDERRSPPPPERRSVQRLMRGIKAVYRAQEEKNPGLIVDSYETAFNANMCDELGKLLNSSEAQFIKFDFKLSPEWISEPEYSQFEQIRLTVNAIPVLREAAASLKHVEVDPTVTIIGRIVFLSSRESPADLENLEGTREFAIECAMEDGLIKVKLQVDPATFKRVYEAWGRDEEVLARGQLEQSGRQWKLKNPRDFMFLS